MCTYHKHMLHSYVFCNVETIIRQYHLHTVRKMRLIATDVARWCWCVCLCVGHKDILCKNGRTDLDAI